MWPSDLTQGPNLLMHFVLTGSLIFLVCFPPFQLDSSMPDENTKPQEYWLYPIGQHTQSWFRPLLNLVVDNLLLLPQSDNLLLLPHTGEQHPLRKKMRLMACKLSGKASAERCFSQSNRNHHAFLGRCLPQAIQALPPNLDPAVQWMEDQSLWSTSNSSPRFSYLPFWKRP